MIQAIWDLHTFRRDYSGSPALEIRFEELTVEQEEKNPNQAKEPGW